MAKRGDPKVLRFVVLFLRHYADRTQSELGEAAGITQGTISEYEAGKTAPSEEALRQMAAAARVPWPLVVLLRRFLTALLAWLERVNSPGLAREEEEKAIERAAGEAARLAVAPYWLEETADEVPPLERERREAEEKGAETRREPFETQTPGL